MSDSKSTAQKRSRVGLTDPSQIVGSDGLSYLRGIIDGSFPAPPISQTLDFWLVDVRNGFARFEGQPAEAFYNPLGIVHGGWTATLLDSAMACSIHSTLKAGEGYTTTDFSVTCVRPIGEASGQVRAEGEVLHRGRRMATAHGRLIDAKGKLLAHGTETCMIFPA